MGGGCFFLPLSHSYHFHIKLAVNYMDVTEAQEDP